MNFKCRHIVLVLALGAVSVSGAANANGLPDLFDYIKVSPTAIAKKKKKYEWVNAYAFSLASLMTYIPTHKNYNRVSTGQERFKAIGLKYCRENQKTEFSGAVPKGVLGAEDSAPIDTQYYLLYNDKAVVLVFRGSEGDWAAPQGSKQQVKFDRDWINTDANVRFMRPWGRKMGKVHSGFYWAYASVKRAHSLIPRIKKCMRHKDPHNPGKGNRSRKRALFLAGHSLGGTVAQVAAIDIEHYEKIPVAGIYSYGSPRAFSLTLKNKFQKKFGSHAHRWVNNNDLVTGLPPAGWFHHAGRYHHIKSKKKVKLDRGVHFPRTPSPGDHSMVRYVERIWGHTPIKYRRKVFGSARFELTPTKLIQRAFRGLVVTANGDISF